MKLIGLTGKIGSGKSFIAKKFQAKGYDVIDSDNLVHELYKNSIELRGELLKEFGAECLNEEGVSRDFFRKNIFTHREMKQKLQAIVYPFYFRKILELIKAKTNDVIIEGAVLHECAPLVEILDEIWIVEAEESIRFSRLKNRGLQEDDIQNRINNQRNLNYQELFRGKKIQIIAN